VGAFLRLAASPTAAHATAIDCDEIILPVKQPLLLVSIASAGTMPRCMAVTLLEAAEQQISSVEGQEHISFSAESVTYNG
jgi:hypothetical protein